MHRAAEAVDLARHRVRRRVVDVQPAAGRLYRRRAGADLVILPDVVGVGRHDELLIAPMDQVGRVADEDAAVARVREVRALEADVFAVYLLREKHAVAIVDCGRQSHALDMQEVLRLRDAYLEAVGREAGIEDVIGIPYLRDARILDALVLGVFEDAALRLLKDRLGVDLEVVAVLRAREAEDRAAVRSAATEQEYVLVPQLRGAGVIDRFAFKGHVLRRDYRVALVLFQHYLSHDYPPCIENYTICILFQPVNILHGVFAEAVSG